MRSSGFNIKSLTLTAKEKICFNREKACSGEECDYARGYYDRMPEAREALFTQDAFTREGIAALAAKHRVCPCSSCRWTWPCGWMSSSATITTPSIPASI